MLLEQARKVEDPEERFGLLLRSGELFCRNSTSAPMAVSPLEAAHQIKPDDHDTVVALADAYLAAGQHEKAHLLLDEAITSTGNRRGPRSADLQVRMAKLAEVAGDRQTQLHWLNVALESNKRDAVKVMRQAAEGTGIRVVSMRVRYPQGAEKQLIYALKGRKVPAGGLPMDVATVVQNVGTAAAVAEAVVDGKPLYERIVTITGSPVANPGNWVLRCGTSTADALRLVGGVTRDPAKIIAGGPMMGRSIYSLDVPVMKNTSGILLMDTDEVVQYSGGPCIHCGRCVDACPMELMAGTLSVQAENERFDLAEQWNAFDCIECGCCAYVCPSGRPLVQHMRRAKAEVVARRRAAQSK